MQYIKLSCINIKSVASYICINHQLKLIRLSDIKFKKIIHFGITNAIMLVQKCKKKIQQRKNYIIYIVL